MLIYIAAPLGDPDPAVRAWHRERANLLAALAFAEGHSPVCVHPYAELAMGSDTDPTARKKGLNTALRSMGYVYNSYSTYTGCGMWVLTRDDGTLSAGCYDEDGMWRVARAIGRNHIPEPTKGMWTAWRHRAAVSAPHLLPEFDRLAVRP